MVRYREDGEIVIWWEKLVYVQLFGYRFNLGWHDWWGDFVNQRCTELLNNEVNSKEFYNVFNLGKDFVCTEVTKTKMIKLLAAPDLYYLKRSGRTFEVSRYQVINRKAYSL